jgi:hypothetical protein
MKSAKSGGEKIHAQGKYGNRKRKRKKGAKKNRTT